MSVKLAFPPAVTWIHMRVLLLKLATTYLFIKLDCGAGRLCAFVKD